MLYYPENGLARLITVDAGPARDLPQPRGAERPAERTIHCHSKPILRAPANPTFLGSVVTCPVGWLSAGRTVSRTTVHCLMGSLSSIGF
jgi:hypothetical protein